jgi:hypothetical protein
MPWTNPETFTAGQTLTAASMNIVSGNARMGRAVFTNEAARDAAITSPEEGMIAYLTTPTEPAATGTITAIPTGITTIYNGSAWVCITPVGCSSNTSGTYASGTYANAMTGGDTAIHSVTLRTGTTAKVEMSGYGNTNAASQGNFIFVVSGATTRSGVGAEGVLFAVNTVNVSSSRVMIVTGLTAGVNTFTLWYSNGSLGTLTLVSRNLVVTGVA